MLTGPLVCTVSSRRGDNHLVIDMRQPSHTHWPVDQHTAHSTHQQETAHTTVSEAHTHPHNYITYINKYKTLLQHYHN